MAADEIKAIVGMNWSKYLFSSEIESLNRRQKTGLTIGVGYGFGIAPKMKIEAGVSYNEKGAKTSLEYAPGKSASGTFSNASMTLAFFFKYFLREGASPYAGIGPEFGIVLTHKLKIPEYDDSFNIADNTNKFIAAINVALGYELPFEQWGLFAEVRYNRWLTNIFKDSAATVKIEAIAFLLGGVYYL